MRRPTTKTPYAYFHHGSRHRGRPVHRIYTLTHRPEGGLTWIQFNPGNGGRALGFTKDFNYWWILQHNAPAIYDRVLLAAEPGRAWNESFLWGVTVTTGATWADVVAGPGRIKGPFGALPFAIERMTTSP
jgi:hypothetical protein